MVYVEVLVASSTYHGQEFLTYSTSESLRMGSVVLVPLRSKHVSGIVVKTVKKPSFPVKRIVSIQVSKPLPSQVLDLAWWLTDYYAAPVGTVISQFIPTNLLKSPASVLALTQPTETSDLPPLTKAQSRVSEELAQSDTSAALLHGVTGSGKTRIYLDIGQDVLLQGKSIVVLTPEIGLTTQIAQAFSSLRAPVVVFHSNLTATQRRTLWLQILYATQPLIVIGPRSALFVPLKNIGLIIVDEAHDPAYKQDQTPRYHALRVAAQLARLHGARVIFGTATPLVSEYYFLEQKGVPILKLHETALKTHHQPEVTIVTISDRKQFSRSSYLSDKLLQEIESALHVQRQSLVFLNRRGTARVVICQNGDWQALCPRCDMPLTYHGDTHRMRCHTCGYSSEPPSQCPLCGSNDIIFRNLGTKALTNELQRLFPQARVQRFDSDNKKDELIEKHYQTIRSGEVDILVGTQLLVKGLDLPKLQMVGVVAADSSLYFPDYTAEEQTYQLISQVIGRVGRGHGHSAVVIQTNNPSGRALLSAVSHDWDLFYQAQLAERKDHHFPPFFHILKLSVARKQQAAAVRAAEKFKELLLLSSLPIEISGPAPVFYEKQHARYVWQLIIRAKRRDVLLQVIDKLPSNWGYDIDPINLL